MKKKIDKIREIKRAARFIIGNPNKGKKTGPYPDKSKEENKKICRKKVEVE